MNAHVALIILQPSFYRIFWGSHRKFAVLAERFYLPKSVLAVVDNDCVDNIAPQNGKRG